ncbi:MULTISPECIES: peptidoglycan-binding domain-containing protein [Fischerella]|uniref:Cell wall-binding protein n=1 Tax=Fischerella muscicola CCMEE 5323 TaxID=2019572 RepID=A0A2N6JZL0_FISMU|nr:MULTISPECIES: peptidoglycan-binding protein [Fischerella]MBD2434374.1 peptidoglycan-binding protein [Fischerella sp. FACHB-380]PLZ86740.1 cell wall-binding protein [Fischerella muscicola CCMEE 5323]
MDNLAYLHVAFAYEESPSTELVFLSSWLENAAAPDWKRLSGKAWKHMLPLVLSLSILSAVGSALALERGDQGPSVRSLQQKLRNAGFYQAPITQVYDFDTEAAVRRFQKAAGIQVNGIAGPTTLQTLQKWPKGSNSSQLSKLSSLSNPTPKLSTVSYRTQQPSTANLTTTNKRRNPNLLQKGDEGQAVKALQERLRIAGYYYGKSTGIFGPITEESVKRFQQAYNLRVDGVVGPATLRKLPPVGVGYGEETPKPAKNRDNLTVGDRGEAVRVLQAQLIKAGYLQGEPNGYYGPYTADAVRRFQADNYLKASGIAGPTTRAKLYSMLNPTSKSKSEFSVLEIQRRLQERGFYKGPLNGVMGDETKRAIKQAQEFYGISLSDVRSGTY